MPYLTLIPFVRRSERLDLMRRRITVAETLVEIGGHLHASTPKNHQQGQVPIPGWLAGFRLIRLAEQLWTATGQDGLRDYQRLLGHAELTHDQVVDRLSRLELEVADAVRRWPAP